MRADPPPGAPEAAADAAGHVVVVPQAPVAAGTEPIERISTFHSLRYPEYRLLFISGLFIFLGVQAQMIVRGWLAAELTGSNRGLGGVFFGFAIPMLLLTPFGGVAADRFPKRTVLLWSSVLLVVSALWVGVADALGVLEYWMLVGSSAVQAAGFAIFGPARISFTSELVDRRSLPNAVILSQISMNSTRIVGPAAGGALIGVAWIGTAGTYLITAALMVIALVIIIPLPKQAKIDRSDRPSPLAELRDGMRYVRANRPVRLLIASSYAVIMLGFPHIAFLPLMATEVFDVGSAGFGIMNAVSGAAAVIVSLRIARFSGADSWRIQVLAGTVFGLGIVALGIAPSFPLALAALFVVGGGASAFQAMNNTLILTESEPEYHGRVQSLLMLSFSGFGLAALPLGALADSIGLRTVFVGMGVASAASMILYQLARRRLPPPATV